MTVAQRIDLLVAMGQYITANGEAWQQAKELAVYKNGWFIQPFIERATANIADQFLAPAQLKRFASKYPLPDGLTGKKLGTTMAGNIPLVGFHDFMCGFLAGHTQLIKLSEKDNVLLPHLVAQFPVLANLVYFEQMLKGCDAYIATGSNNTARYFEQYFGKYPNIIRKNRTSVALLTGQETEAELSALADDVHLFFGLGCRNVTKIFVPTGYDFVPLLSAFRKYNYFAEHNKFKNNYDYNLAIHILNKVFYMTNDSVLLVEDERLFSPISQLHYSYYQQDPALLAAELQQSEEVQCIVGQSYIPFGAAQMPDITQYADGVDTLQFLTTL